MDKYINSVTEILNKLEIEDGILVDPFHIVGDGSFGGRIEVKEVLLNDLEHFLNTQADVKAILVNESIAQEPNRIVMQNLKNKIKEQNVYLIVCAKNPVDRDTVFELLSGHQTTLLDIQGYTGAGIREYMRKSGYTLIAENKEKTMNAQDSTAKTDKNIFLESGNVVYQYLSWLEGFIHSELNVDFFVQVYKVAEEVVVDNQESDSEAPFLSIITRTQGRRPESLRETFLTLAGQSCMDFEVLVMGHNLKQEEKENVLKAIEENPEYLRKKIRFVPVEGGNRSTPINRGFEEARGEYAVILDDDDYVFDHWVSSFKEKAAECPGSVLHAYVIAQDWTRIVTKDGKEALRASGSPQNQFCRDFHMINELYGNYCPTLGLAFPLFPFRYMGFRFNETLDTTEDWDYLMRVSSICGVADIQEPTCLYRLWKNAENSHSIHSQKEWNNNRKRIQDQFRSWPLQLPVRYTNEMIELAEKYPALLGGDRNERSQVTSLYYSSGYGFNEKNVMSTGSNLPLPDFRYEYTDMEPLGELSFIRWDPYDSGNIYVENLRISIFTADGGKIERTISQMDTNGFKSRNCIVFFHPDPQVILHFRKKIVISKVVITGAIKKEIPVEVHNYLAMQYDSNIVHKAKKAIKHVGKKVLKK